MLQREGGGSARPRPGARGRDGGAGREGSQPLALDNKLATNREAHLRALRGRHCPRCPPLSSRAHPHQESTADLAQPRRHSRRGSLQPKAQPPTHPKPQRTTQATPLFQHPTNARPVPSPSWHHSATRQRIPKLVRFARVRARGQGGRQSGARRGGGGRAVLWHPTPPTWSKDCGGEKGRRWEIQTLFEGPARPPQTPFPRCHTPRWYTSSRSRSKGGPTDGVGGLSWPRVRACRGRGLPPTATAPSENPASTQFVSQKGCCHTPGTHQGTGAASGAARTTSDPAQGCGAYERALLPCAGSWWGKGFVQGRGRGGGEATGQGPRRAKRAGGKGRVQSPQQLRAPGPRQSPQALGHSLASHWLPWPRQNTGATGVGAPTAQGALTACGCSGDRRKGGCRHQGLRPGNGGSQRRGGTMDGTPGCNTDIVLHTA
jgi:hypothetical protein